MVRQKITPTRKSLCLRNAIIFFQQILLLFSRQQGLKLCVFWHKVCSWLCQVCSWLCWSVLCEVEKWMKNNGWKSYLCLEIVEKNEQIALLNFKIFWGNAPRPPYCGGATAPLPRPNPPRHSAPRSGPSAPPSSLCVCSWHFEIF